MKDAILASIQSRPLTTFQHLAADVPGFSGNLGMFTPQAPNIIIWHAVSEAGIGALGALIGQRIVRMEPAPQASYLVTDDLPEVSICRDVREFAQGTEIKWFPVVFRMQKNENRA